MKTKKLYFLILFGIILTGVFVMGKTSGVSAANERDNEEIPETYTVTYHTNYPSEFGLEEVEVNVIVEAGSKYKIVDQGFPTVEGYVQYAWIIDPVNHSSSQFDYSNTQIIVVNDNIDLYAFWRKSVKITFDAMDGAFPDGKKKIIHNQKLDYSSSANFSNIPNPSKEGYLFVGWYVPGVSDDNDISTYFSPMDAVSKRVPKDENLTIEARYSNANQINITFRPNGGKFWNDGSKSDKEFSIVQNAVMGATYSQDYFVMNSDNSSEGFKGWRIENDDEGILYSAAEVVKLSFSEDTTFIAEWANRYTVTFISDEGYIYGDVNRKKDTSYKLEGEKLYGVSMMNFKGSGKLFVGWKLKDDETGAIYDKSYEDEEGEPIKFSDVYIDKNMTFIAIWKESYTVTFHSNDGYLINKKNKTSENGVEDLFEIKSYIRQGKKIDEYYAASGKHGGIFKGWKTDGDDTLYVNRNTDLNENEKYICDYIVEKDTTFEVVWDEAYYVTYYSEVYPNHIFKGWQVEGDDTYYVPLKSKYEDGEKYIGDYELKGDEHNVIFKAAWVEAYTITFKSDVGYLGWDHNLTEEKMLVEKGKPISEVYPNCSGSNANRDGYGVKGYKKEVDGEIDNEILYVLDPIKSYPSIDNPTNLQEYIPTGDTVFNVIWAPVRTILFDGNGQKIYRERKSNSTDYTYYDTYKTKFLEGRIFNYNIYSPYSRTGYTFIGYKVLGDTNDIIYVTSEKNAINGKEYIGHYLITVDTTFVAQWDVTCTVSLLSNGGYFDESKTITSKIVKPETNGKITEIYEPIFENHVFDGYKISGDTTGTLYVTDPSKANGDTAVYIGDYTVEGNTTFKASWSEKKPDNTGIEIGVTFSDEVFRNYISKNIDEDKDGYLSDEECEKVTDINISDKQLTSLSGIENFKRLKKLNCCGCSITDLDVSYNTELDSLDCSNNLITNLTIGDGNKLQELKCYSNKLSDLNMGLYTALKKLYCWDNNIETLSIEVCQNVKYIPDSEDAADLNSYETWEGGIAYDSERFLLIFVVCEDVRLDAFVDQDFKEYAKKYDLNKDYILSSSEISKVKSLELDGEEFAVLDDLRRFKNLRNLTMKNCQVGRLDLHNLMLLEKINISGNERLNSVVLDECYELKEADIKNNPLMTELIFNKGYKLTRIDASGNNLGLMNLRYCYNLKTLICFDNQLMDISCYESKKLDTLYCWDNAFETLVISMFDNNLKFIPDTSDDYYDKFIEWDNTIERIDTDRLLFSDTCNSPIVEINETFFSDANFRAYVGQYDENKNGILSGKERKAVTEINVSNKNIASLKGIEYFPSLKKLDCSYNNIESINLCSNSSLQKFNCSHNKLTSFVKEDVLGFNSSIKEINLAFNKLESFSVTQWTSVETLDISHNNLTEVNMENCFLTNLICNDNKLSELTGIKQGTNIYIYCYNNLLNELNITSKYVKELYAWNNLFSTVTISAYNSVGYVPKTGTTAYDDFVEWGGNITSENSGGQYTLTYVNLEYIPIDEAHFKDAGFRSVVSGSAIDKNTDRKLVQDELDAVTELETGESVQSLQGIEHFKNLKTLKCSSKGITSLDVSKNSELITLDCSGSSLVTLNVDDNIKLKKLVCDDNKLTELSITNASVEELSCKNNKISTISFTENSGLITLDCSDNILSEIDCNTLSELEKLDCSGNNIDKLDLSANEALLELVCDNNELTDLGVSENKKLKKLICYNNKLPELLLNSLAKLNMLYAWDNNFINASVIFDSDEIGITPTNSSYIPSEAIYYKKDKSDISSYLKWNGAVEYLYEKNTIYYLDIISVPMSGNEIPGDINRDGNLDDLDIIYANAFIDGSFTPSDIDLSQADVNGDGKITSDDKELIEKKIDGTIPGFPIEKVLDGLNIKKTPTKLEYYIGDTLDLTGMVVTAHYTNDEIENVSGYDVVCNLSTLGKKKVEVSYTEGNITRKAEFTVTVVKKNNSSDSDDPSGQDQPDTSTGNKTESPANSSTTKPTTQPVTDKPETTQKTTTAKKKAVKKKTQKITAKAKLSLDLGKKNISVGAKTTGNGKLKYKSLNPKIVKINSKGKMTAVGIGKATIVITATGTSKYKTATKRVVVTVGIAKQVCKVKTMSNGYIRANWNKDKNADKYEVHFSNTKTFKKWWTKEFKKSETALNGRLGTKGTIYYMRVRSVKKVKGKTYYGAWSDVVKIILK